MTAITDPTSYLPGKLASNSDGDYPGRLVKIALDPEHPWHYDRDGHVKTNEPIPMKQIVDVSPPIVTERRTRENGNPSIETRVIDSSAPLTRGTSKLPPAWTEVFVATDPNAPLQVQGRDEAGRVQSIYSDAHTASQAAAKFVRVRALEREMDKHRRRLEADAGHDPAAAAVRRATSLSSIPATRRCGPRSPRTPRASRSRTSAPTSLRRRPVSSCSTCRRRRRPPSSPRPATASATRSQRCWATPTRKMALDSYIDPTVFMAWEAAVNA